ncbi:MAG: PQQ-binding-like beta-propeller repeat protein [Methylocystaceae bacterium]
MKRIFGLIIIILVIFSTSQTNAITTKLEQYNPTTEKNQSGQIIWQLKGVGKPSADLIFLPNQSLLVTVGKNLSLISDNGQLKWQSKISNSGTSGQPVVYQDGTILVPGTSSLAQTKINGAPGWKFVVFPSAKGTKNPVMSLDITDGLLYLPLADALYTFTLSGKTLWRLSPWDSTERYNTRLSTTRHFLTAAADSGTFYAVMGDKKADYKLVAVSSQGKLLWSYWLGDIVSAQLTTSSTGDCCLTVSCKRVKPPQKGTSTASTSGNKVTNTGKVLYFKSSSGQPAWSYSFACSGSLPAPVINKQRVFVSAPGHMWVMDAATGALLWDNNLLNLITRPTINDNTGFLYAGTTDNQIIAVSPQGRLAWSRKLDGPIERPILLDAEKNLYLLTQKGSLYKIKDNYNGTK